MSAIKNFIFGVVTVIVTLAMYLAAVEIVLRADERDLAHHLYSWRSFHIADRDTGWSLEPGASGYIPTWNGPIYTSINEYGIRERSFPLKKEPDKTRILFLGDSFLYDNAYRYEETYKHLTEFRLGRWGYRAEILNAGVNGYGTDQEYLYYRYKGRRFSPDICVLNLYIGNDVRDNAAGIYTSLTGADPQKPYFTLDKGRDDVVLENHPYTGDLASAFVDAYNSPISIFGYKPFELLHLKSLKLHEAKLNLVWKYKIKPLFGSAAGETDEQDKKFDSLFDYLLVKEPSQRWLDAIRITELLIGKLKAEVERDGGAFGVVIIPMRAQLEQNPGEDENVNIFAVEDRLIPFLKSENIPYINLYDNFKPLHNTQAALYEDGVHWNSGGHAVASFAVAKWLKDNFTIQTGEAPKWSFD